ncbi:MAG: GH3 auxin-responsive promoter family protein [Bacteroidota bacterium]
MPLINSIVSWMMKKRIHQIDLFMKYPHDVQDEWLRKLIAAAKNTEWGKKFEYKSIKTLKEYKERVPVQDYETIKPYITRLRKGEQNLLWPSEIKWFSKSSGTTSDKSKFIPVSIEALEECHYKGGKDMLSLYCNNNPDTKIFTGKGLTLGGSYKTNNPGNESYYGDLSSILIQNTPLWVELIRTPKRSIALMDEFESKIEKIAAATINENVTNIAGVPSWALVLLKRILQKSGKSNLLEVWPGLELFMHGGVNFNPYREQFKKIIPSYKMNYLAIYSASEGFFGIQDLTDSEEMLLMLDYGVYYEFIPMEEIDKENPKTLILDEVETDINYAIIISTNAGLWRYKIGDTIKFTSLNPFRIEITGRTVHFINAFGEELIIDNAEKALAIACERSGAVIKEYTAAPVYMSENGTGTHEWLIEFETKPGNIDFFKETLDNALKSLNSDYEAKRVGNLTLKEPVIREIPTDTFYNWLKRKGKLGGQNKVPRLSNDRKIVEEILTMIES